MAVKFDKQGFCIRFESRQPANDYVEVLNDLVDLLRDRDDEMGDKGRFYAHELFRSMLPDYGQAQLMFEDMEEND